MSRLHEPLKQHVHGDMCSEVNDMIIRIKVHYCIPLTPENTVKITDARGRHVQPTWEEMIELLSKVRDEMDQCTKPYKLY